MGFERSPLSHNALNKLSSSVGSFAVASRTITENGFSIVSDRNCRVLKLRGEIFNFFAGKTGVFVAGDVGFAKQSLSATALSVASNKVRCKIPLPISFVGMKRLKTESDL